MSEDRLPGTGSEQSGITRRQFVKRGAVGAVGLASIGSIPALLAACGSSSSSSSSSASPTALATALPSGGLSALETAAKAEGKLNTIALPPNWANYGKIISTFQSKYGITVNNAGAQRHFGPGEPGDHQPQGPVARARRGRRRSVVCRPGQSQGLFTPYFVATWARIPDAMKDADGLLVRRLLRRDFVRHQHQRAEGPAEGLVRPAQPALPRPGGHRRRPALGQRRLLGGLRRGPGQRRFARQHRARHRLLRQAQEGRQLHPRRCPAGQHLQGLDADRHHLGLPEPGQQADFRRQPALHGVDPQDRRLRRLLLPGDQRRRPPTPTPPASGRSTSTQTRASSSTSRASRTRPATPTWPSAASFRPR